MLIVNNTVFLPQERGRSFSEKPGNAPLTLTNRQLHIENCKTLGDVIHEPELFVDKDRSLDFLCVICQCICNTPMDIGCKNGHIYCKQCLADFFSTSVNQKCPQCNDSVNKYSIRINHFALRLLLKLRIFCPFSLQHCEDEKEEDMYQCEWIGAYSDIIEHLKSKCKYGTFIHQESIDKVRSMQHQLHSQHSSDTDKHSHTESNTELWSLSRAEITSYKVFWEQICETDNHLGNHVNRSSVDDFLAHKIALTESERNTLWWIVCSKNTQQQLVTETEFYAALHIARLHKNKYKPQCNLHELYSLPLCLSPARIDHIRSNIKQSAVSAEDLEKVQAAMTQERLQNETNSVREKSFTDIYNKRNQINLETKIGTMRQLRTIAGHETIEKPSNTKTVKTTQNGHSASTQSMNGHASHSNHTKGQTQNGWTINKQDIEQYRRFFRQLDENNTGYVNGKNAFKFFVKSRLSQKQLALIWNRVDEQKSGRLTEAQFYAMMYIVMKVKKENTELPSDFVIPFSLREANVLKVMNGENIADDLMNGWTDLFPSSSQTRRNQGNSTYHSSSNSMTIFDSSMPSMLTSSGSNNASQRRTEKIDSVEDWGSFGIDF